jgi:hypothetical protein
MNTIMVEIEKTRTFSIIIWENNTKLITQRKDKVIDREFGV